MTSAGTMRYIFDKRISAGRSLAMLLLGGATIFSAPFITTASHAANSASVKIEASAPATLPDKATSAIASIVPMHKVVDAFDGNDGRLMLPRSRPDYASTLGGIAVQIEGPVKRPSMEDMLPAATADIKQMVLREAGKRTSQIFDLTLSSGETLAKILKRAKFSNQDIASVSQALSGKVDLRRLQIGTRFTAALDIEGQPIALQLHLPRDAQKNGAFKNIYLDHYVIRHDGYADAEIKGWQSLRAIRPVELRSVHAGNEISLSLYEAAQQVRIPLKVLDEFVRVMSFSVDFQREVQTGDQFELVYDTAMDKLTGKILSTDSLQYAGIVLSGKKMGFYRFVHPNGREGWYDRNGESAVRTLMRTPVNGARISSGFGMRRHPTTGYNAMHRGLDFAVPTGTPILAAGTGHIEYVGWNGNYGRYIRIRHNATYKTAYAHLSRFAGGMRNGREVQQGEVIGYVGSTGRSTGPHLHYEILVNNRRLNPLTVKLPTGDAVPAELMPAFKTQVERVEAKMRNSVTPLYAGISLQQALLSR
ncbi:peptidoglycan DD-metalloendopeptidase family protein [Alphaproteobacteria bacterium]|nr:peptidoglycan DD-metalloendopeptidase family protein [Alphaproteobacteria bacterium]